MIYFKSYIFFLYLFVVMAAPSSPLCGFGATELVQFNDVEGAGDAAPGTALPPEAQGSLAGLGQGVSASGGGGGAAHLNSSSGGASGGTEPPSSSLTQVQDRKWMVIDADCEEGAEANALRTFAASHMDVFEWRDEPTRTQMLRPMERPTLAAYTGGRAAIVEEGSLGRDVIPHKNFLGQYLHGQNEAHLASSRRMLYLGTNALLNLVTSLSDKMEAVSAESGEGSAQYQSLDAIITTIAERQLHESVFRASSV